MKSRSRFFTLIELIVVMAIIAVMTSMLLPGVIHARLKSQRGYCQNNLRQIGLAAYSYSDEYDHYVMPSKFGNAGNYNHWINFLHEEVINVESVFQCPALSKDDLFNPAGGGNRITKAGYIMNVVAANNWAGAAIASDPSKSWGWGSANLFIRESEIIEPSEKLWIMDVVSGGISSNHSGVRQFSETDYGLVSAPPLAGFRRVGYHHQFGFNALMGDNHTEHVTASDPDQWVVVVR